MPFPVRALQMDGGSEFQGAGDAAGQIERLVIDREPIVYRFESGRIMAIEGGASADLLRRHLEAFDNPHVYRIAHIGWGTHDGALWGGPNFTWADWYNYYGSINVHFGANCFDSPAPYSGLGGKVPSGTPHWGGSLLNHSIWLDDELILDEGRIVPKRLK